MNKATTDQFINLMSQNTSMKSSFTIMEIISREFEQCADFSTKANTTAFPALLLIANPNSMKPDAKLAASTVQGWASIFLVQKMRII